MSDLLTGVADYAAPVGGDEDDGDREPVARPVTQDGPEFLINWYIQLRMNQGMSAMEAVEDACNELNADPDRYARCGNCNVFRDQLYPGRLTRPGEPDDGAPAPLCYLCKSST